MVETFGLTHIALAVQDAERAFRFYQDVFGMVAVYRENGFIQAQTPGCRDVLVFEETGARARRFRRHRPFRLSGWSIRPTSTRRCGRSSARAARSSAAASSAPASRTCSAAIPTATRSRSGTSCRPPPIRCSRRRAR